MQTRLTTNKKQQRREMLAIRRSLSPAQRLEYSRLIISAILADEDYRNSSTVMLFAAMADEVQTEELIRYSLRAGKVICLPYIANTDKNNMVAAQIKDYQDLIPGVYGILSVNPENLSIIAPDTIDLVLVPGVAFKPTGQRLGMGAGYYDKFLAQIPGVKTIAPIYHCQLIDNLVYEEHDAVVRKICTEKGVITCDRNHY